MAIAKAVEDRLGNRQGQRTDLQLPQNFEEVKGKETLEIAAQKAGFGNKETYRQVDKVAKEGKQELINAPDENKIKPNKKGNYSPHTL